MYSHTREQKKWRMNNANVQQTFLFAYNIWCRNKIRFFDTLIWKIPAFPIKLKCQTFPISHSSESFSEADKLETRQNFNLLWRFKALKFWCEISILPVKNIKFSCCCWILDSDDAEATRDESPIKLNVVQIKFERKVTKQSQQSRGDEIHCNANSTTNYLFLIKLFSTLIKENSKNFKLSSIHHIAQISTNEIFEQWNQTTAKNESIWNSTFLEPSNKQLFRLLELENKIFGDNRRREIHWSFTYVPRWWQYKKKAELTKAFTLTRKLVQWNDEIKRGREKIH